LFAARGYKVFTEKDIARFLIYLEISDSGCLLWTGAKNSLGYGNFSYRYNGKYVFVGAHCFSYSAFVGDIPEGMWVLHSCDNPPCVRPDHLFLGTHHDNMKDAADKGRMNRGENNCNAVLDPEIVLRIRRLHDSGYINNREIADRLGVSRSLISHVVKGKLWGWVKE
jgi:predicted XRE-type DNA-binding protein